MLIEQYSNVNIIELVSCSNRQYELKCWSKTSSTVITMNEKDLLELKRDIEHALVEEAR